MATLKIFTALSSSAEKTTVRPSGVTLSHFSSGPVVAIVDAAPPSIETDHQRRVRGGVVARGVDDALAVGESAKS